MSTQFSTPRPSSESPLPGMTLVQRLEGAKPSGTPSLARIYARLCIYALPAIVWALLQIVPAATGIAARSAADGQFVLVFSMAWIAAVECLGVARIHGLNQEHTGTTAVVISILTAACAGLLALRMLGLHAPGTVFVLIDLSVLAIMTVAAKLWFRGAYAARQPFTRIAVAIATPRAGQTRWRILRKDVSRHEISGAIRLEDHHASHADAEGLSTGELARELRRDQVDGVLIAAPAHAVNALSEQIQAACGLNAPARFVVRAREGFWSGDEVSNSDCLYLLNTNAAPAETPQYRLLKRAFDLLFALAALLLGAPALLLIAVAIKISSRGDIFFVQHRVGWNGRVFRMYKFRTMRHVSATESETRWTEPGDPRRTAVGRFLRRYSLDELPQFLNVLLGDMSVVGPRPERPYFVSSFRRQIDEYHRRHQLKVGITGWAQVNGLRGDTCIRTRLMYDLYYLQNWGLVFDLRIILRTLFCIFKGSNAY